MRSPIFIAAALFLTASAHASSSTQTKRAGHAPPAVQPVIQHIHQNAFFETSTSSFSELFIRVTNGNTRQAFRYSADPVTADALCKHFLRSLTAHPTKWTAENSVDVEPVVKLDYQSQLTQDQSTKYLNFLECVN